MLLNLSLTERRKKNFFGTLGRFCDGIKGCESVHFWMLFFPLFTLDGTVIDTFSVSHES